MTAITVTLSTLNRVPCTVLPVDLLPTSFFEMLWQKLSPREIGTKICCCHEALPALLLFRQPYFGLRLGDQEDCLRKKHPALPSSQRIEAASAGGFDPPCIRAPEWQADPFHVGQWPPAYTKAWKSCWSTTIHMHRNLCSDKHLVLGQNTNGHTLKKQFQCIECKLCKWMSTCTVKCPTRHNQGPSYARYKWSGKYTL